MKIPFILSSLVVIALYGLLSSVGWQDITNLNHSSNVDWSQLLSPILLGQIILFVFAHLFILLLVLIVCILPALAFTQTRTRATAVACILFLLLVYALIGYSTHYYPWLVIAQISDSLNPTNHYQVIVLIAATFLAIAWAISLILHSKRDKRLAILQAMAIACFIWPLLPASNHEYTVIQSERRQPDIIVVGVDSLSLYQAQEHAEQLPFFSKLLQQGTLFTDAVTPIGRTFAAWNSILSGRSPASSGVRFNLTEFNPNQIRNSLPTDLKKLGYFNIFAQDERRFSNINEEYGFDISIGPAVGAIDFILPLFSDHLFSAYFTNSIFGRWLLPSFYINRVSSETYAPELFVHQILEKTAQVKPDLPLFFASHFCLAHFPYKWRDYRSENNYQQEELTLYQDSLRALDRQLQALFNGLKQQGRLDNAIIVLLSDHGEGLGSEPALWTNSTLPIRDFGLILRGHGNSLLARDQSNVIINIRDTRLAHQPQSIHAPVSLVDIRPTILSLLNQPLSSDLKIDGVVLPPATPYVSDHRYLFMETGMMMDLPRPDATASELSEAVQDKMQGYRINNEGRLVLTAEYIETNMPKKQFGVIHNQHLLLSSPNKPETYLLINRATGNSQTGSHHDFEMSSNKHLIEKLRCYQNNNRDCYLASP